MWRLNSYCEPNDSNKRGISFPIQKKSVASVHLRLLYATKTGNSKLVILQENFKNFKSQLSNGRQILNREEWTSCLVWLVKAIMWCSYMCVCSPVLCPPPQGEIPDGERTTRVKNRRCIVAKTGCYPFFSLIRPECRRVIPYLSPPTLFDASLPLSLYLSTIFSLCPKDW